MLVTITLLSFLIFGVTYPLFLLLTAKDPIKHNFNRFHLACPVVLAGLSIVSFWMMPFPQHAKAAGIAWLAAGLLVTGYYWNKDKIDFLVIGLLVLSGLKVYHFAFLELVGHDKIQIIISVIAGLMVSGMFYAMNLGHFYLNVHGLKISHLKNAVSAFGLLTAVRLMWDLFYIASGKIMYRGEEQTVLSFMNSLDGFLLWVAFFFGTLFPLAGLYFAFGTLKLKNTQATTGILYVLLSAVLLGDLAFKYYLLKFSIPM
jgi:hypothetical protein